MKLGLGAYSGGGSVYNAIRTVLARVVLLADTALSIAYNLNHSDTLIVGRVSLQHIGISGAFARFAQQPLGATIEEAYNIGVSLADLLVYSNSAIDVWQLYNESVAANDIENYKLLAALELGATRRLHELGRKSCVLNLGVAVGDPTDYPTYFGELLSEADYLGIHAYGPPNGQLMQYDTSNFALRYRRIVAAMKAAGKRCPPIIITECTTYNAWRGTNLTIEDITADLIWFGNRLNEDIYIVGCCAFQVGSLDVEQFGGFDLLDDYLLTRLRAFNQENIMPMYTDAYSGETATPPVQDRLPITLYPDAYIGNNFKVRDLRLLVPRVAAYPRRDLSKVKYIVVHHGGVSGDYTSESVAKYHIEQNGWPSIGYTFVLHPDGNIDWVNDLDRACYNVAGRNDEVMGVLYCGNFMAEQPPEYMLQRGYSLNAEIQFTFGWFIPVVGHRNIALPGYSTSCPGDTWPNWARRVSPIEAQAPPVSQYTFVLGFKDLYNKLGAEVVGSPIEDSHTGIMTTQKTSKGIMTYQSGKQPIFYRSL